MSDPVISRGFGGRRRHDAATANRIPPGQYQERGFPVLSAGPTPRIAPETWDFTIQGTKSTVETPKTWTWAEFQALPHEELTRDIHCVTKWTKLDSHWAGVSVQTLLDQVEYDAQYAIAFCDGDYTTNLPIEDVQDGKAWIVDTYDGQPLEPAHGGPVRLLVPHLYFWKSAKWVRGLHLTDTDEPGFWESLGYHNYGDPWREQRYQGD